MRIDNQSLCVDYGSQMSILQSSIKRLYCLIALELLRHKTEKELPWMKDLNGHKLTMDEINELLKIVDTLSLFTQKLKEKYKKEINDAKEL